MSCSWAADSKEADWEDLLRFIKDIGYISGKAKGSRFLDQAHINYDNVVRKLATVEGFGAFSAGNPEISLKYYAFEYLRKLTGGRGCRWWCR